MPRLDRLWYEIDAETKGFDQGVLQAQDRLKSFTEYAAGNPMAVLGALGVAATLVGIKLAKMAMDFQQQMAMVDTVLDPTQASLKDLTAQVLELNESLPIQNINELTKGLYDIVSSGIDAGKSIEFLNVASKAAVGGVTQVSTAVDGLTTAVNAFRSQGLTVERASDVMFQTVNKGKVTFAELSHSMALGASIAAGMGIKFEDLNAAVAQLSLGGMDARMSMVGVRSAIVNIIKPTEDFARSFPQIAAEFNRAKLESRGFIGFLSDLVVASKGNSEVFVKLFQDVQGFNAVMALTTDGGVAMNKMLKDVEGSAGAADAAMAKMGTTTAATNQILKNQFHNELLALGNDILPAFNSVLEGAVALMAQVGTAGKNLRLKEVVNDLRTLGMTGGGKPLEFPSLFGRYSTSQEGSNNLQTITSFIDMVKESRDVLRGFTNQELQQVQAGMRRFGDSFPDLTGFDDTMAAINDVMKENTKVQSAADAAALKTSKQATAGAVAFTESNAKAVAALTTNVNALKRGEEAATKYAIAIRQLSEANKEAQQAAEDARKADKAGDKAGAEAAQKAAGEALGKATSARQEARQALKDVQDANKQTQDAERSTRDRLANEDKARRDLHFALNDALAKTTATAVDDLALNLARQVAEFRAKLASTPGMTEGDKVSMEAQIKAIETANEKTLELLRSSERVDARLREVDKTVLGLTEPDVRDNLFRVMGEDIDALTIKLKGVDENSTEFKTITESITKLEQGRLKLMSYFLGLAGASVNAAKAEAEARRKAAQAMEKQVREIQALARGALDAGEAFGFISEATSQALANVIDIAANMPLALTGDLSSIGAVLSGVAKLFTGSGDDPQIKASREANTAAIQELSRHIGDLSKALVSGTSLSAAQNAARAITDEIAKLLPGSNNALARQNLRIADNRGLVDPILAQYGLSFKELEDIAKSLGLTLTTFGDIAKVIEAINKADLAAYTDTFAGSIQRLTDEFEAYGVTDPTERLRRTIAFLTSSKGIPGVAKALSGIDTSTAAGASAAIAALQGLFENLASGKITAADLGGASVDEARQAILDLISQLRGEGGGGSTTSFGYNSAITEATGSHIAGLLSSANVYAQRTMAAAEAMVDLLRMGAGLPSLGAPVLSSGGAALEITLNVNVAGVSDTGQAQLVGQAVGRAAIEQISTGLATRLRQQKRALGNVVS